MNLRFFLTVLLALSMSACATVPQPVSREQRVQQATDAEIAFAATMAARDFDAFMDFVSEEAVFVNAGKPLRGKAAIAAHWKPFFEGPSAPFAWKPDLVEVVPSGTLAQSIGPVSTLDGTVIARFYSTWRLEADGQWRVVFDNGYDVCRCPTP